MKFGLIYEIEIPKPWREREEYLKYWEVMEEIQFAEAMGFHSVWSVEHHGLEELSHSSAPEVLFAAASQRTSTIRFGHGAVLIPPPYNHPIRVAERIGALDILSNGRLEVGFARSATMTEMGFFGIEPGDTRGMMEEALEVIPQLMMTERFPGYSGRYVTIGENRNAVPKPIQQPHPPLWVACSSAPSFELAAKYGTGVLCFNIAEPETFEERISVYRDLVQRPERPVGAVNNQVACFIMTLCGEDRDRAIRSAGEGVAWYMGLTPGQSTYWMRDIEPTRVEALAGVESYKYAAVKAPEAFLFGADEEWGEEELAPQRLAERGLICAGDPDDCIKVLERFEALGVDLMLCMMEMGRVSHEETMESIRLFGEHVIPHFSS